MNNTTIIENGFDDVEMMNGLMDRVEVLDRIGTLVMLPTTKSATTKMVADFYGVGYEAINSLFKRNKSEIINNGIKSMPYKNIKQFFGQSILNRAKIKELGLNTGMNNLFSKRAILNIGMLLRDSEVAKELRTQLLNALVEDSVKTTVINNITEEQQLQLDLGNGYRFGRYWENNRCYW